MLDVYRVWGDSFDARPSHNERSIGLSCLVLAARKYERFCEGDTATTHVVIVGAGFAGLNLTPPFGRAISSRGHV